MYSWPAILSINVIVIIWTITYCVWFCVCHNILL